MSKVINTIGGGGSGSGSWELLWTNPNPSDGSGFAAQTVPLDLNNYTEVMIQYWRPNVNQYELDSIASVWGRVGQKIFMQLAYYQLTWRSANVTTTGVAFSTGYLTTAMNQTPSTAATYAVPVRIYAR